jgi:hypothetical protein
MRRITVALLISAAGVAHADPQAAMLRDAPAVSPVLTEHSAGLRCLGGLIEQSQQTPVSVSVRDIDDTTVPVLNEERRLSMGGSFVLHTALSRMETSKVQGVLDDARTGQRQLTLSGAWTQDDLFTGEKGIGIRFRSGNFSGGLGRRTAYDFVAGDFASSVNGRIRLSTAVGVALPRRGNEAFLVIDDGADGANVGFDKRRVQGVQMAQRRILEAVALVHLSDYFQIDYRPCLQATNAAPEAFSGAIRRYERMPVAERHAAVRTELARVGFQTSNTPLRAWDAGSATALMSFQSTHKLPPTGRHSPVLFALLSTMPTPKKA